MERQIIIFFTLAITMYLQTFSSNFKLIDHLFQSYGFVDPFNKGKTLLSSGRFTTTNYCFACQLIVVSNNAYTKLDRDLPVSTQPAYTYPFKASFSRAVLGCFKSPFNYRSNTLKHTSKLTVLESPILNLSTIFFKDISPFIQFLTIFIPRIKFPL